MEIRVLFVGSINSITSGGVASQSTYHMRMYVVVALS